MHLFSCIPNLLPLVYIFHISSFTYAKVGYSVKKALSLCEINKRCQMQSLNFYCVPQKMSTFGLLCLRSMQSYPDLLFYLWILRIRKMYRKLCIDNNIAKLSSISFASFGCTGWTKYCVSPKVTTKGDYQR